jgi:pentatricopeptide repeat protein
MFNRGVSRAFHRVINPHPNSSLRYITHKKATGLPIGQSSLIPHLNKTDWPVNLNQDFLSLDQKHRPPTEVVSSDNATIPDLPDHSGFYTYKPEVRAVMKDLLFAIGRNELDDIVKGFMALKRLESLSKFMDVDVMKTSTILADYLMRAPKDLARTNAETMAIFFATRGFMEPLHSAMAHHLLQDEPDSVLDLWDQHRTWREREVIKRPKQQLFRDDSIMYVTAAAAMKDDYVRAAHALRSTSLTVPPWRISEFAEQFLQTKSPHIRQSFLDFLHDASLARDIEHFRPLVSQVAEIGRRADVSALAELYDSIRDCLERGIFALSGSVPPNSSVQIVDPKMWSLFIWGATQCRNVALAEAIMEDMQRYGMNPTLDMWSMLLRGYAKRGLVEHMMGALKKIQAQGLEPNITCLSIIMGALYDKQLLQPAGDVLRTIQTYSPPAEDPDTPNLTEQLRVAHNVALDGLLRSRAVTQAEKLLQKMEKEGPQPDIVTYNTFLNRYANMQHRQGVASTLRTIADRQLQPDIYTFTILYVGACRNGDEDVKTDLIHRMKSLDVKPNNALLCAAIASILGSGSSDAIPTAMGLLSRMERERDPTIKPNEVTYHTIMHSVDELVLQKALTEEEGFRLMRDLYQKMISRGFKPTRVVHHTLLRIYIRRHDSESLRVALSIFDQLRKEELVTSDSWYILLNGLEKRKEYAVARRMIEVLRRSPHDARGSLLAIVDRINRY